MAWALATAESTSGSDGLLEHGLVAREDRSQSQGIAKDLTTIQDPHVAAHGYGLDQMSDLETSQHKDKSRGQGHDGGEGQGIAEDLTTIMSRHVVDQVNGPGVAEDPVMIRDKHASQEQVHEGVEMDAVMLMQNGQQVGYFEEAEIEVFVQEFRERVWKLRAGDPRKARDAVQLTKNLVVRGLQSRLPAIRQVSRQLDTAIAGFWEGLEGIMNVHQNGKWVTRFWKRIRTQARRVSRTAKQNKQILKDMEVDVAEDIENAAICSQEPDASETRATSSGHRERVQEAHDEEMDVVSAMQRSTPPWRSRPEPRDKWLKDDRRRRRTHVRTFRRRSRSRTPDRKRKGTQKGRSTSTAPRAPKAKARPSTNSGARSSTDVVEIVENPRERDDFTVERAIRLWRELMGLAAHNEPGNAMGLADYMVDNLRASADDMDLSEVHTMLTALVQLQALIGAQASQVLQDRVQEIQRDSEAFVEVPVEEEDTNALMQRSMNRATAEDGVSTFGHWLQRMSDALVDMGPVDAALCSQLLLSQLRTRYGQGAGRFFMGERAASLEALAIAHQGSPVTEEQIRASPEGQNWSRHWWTTLPASERKNRFMPGSSMRR